MIGNPWFALLAFILGAGLTYLRMAGSATRQVAKPVPRRLVMGGLIPGLVDPPADALPVDLGPEWTIRVGSPTSEQPSAAESVVDAAPAVETVELPAVQPLEPPWPTEVDSPEVIGAADTESEQTAPQTVAGPTSEAMPAADAALSAEVIESTAPAEPAEAAGESSAPVQRKIAAGATDEPSTSSWWAAAFDRGDPGPYPGPLRYSSAWPPAGSRVLDVDDEFAAALGAGAAASAESAALFGAASRYAADPEPVRPQRDGHTQGTAPTPPTVEVPVAPDEPEPALEPGEQLIKGNGDSGLYHTPDSPWYARTKAEEWFETEQEAQAAGYERWNSRRK